MTSETQEGLKLDGFHCKGLWVSSPFKATGIFLACFIKLSCYSSTVVFAVNHFFPTIGKVLRWEKVSYLMCVYRVVWSSCTQLLSCIRLFATLWTAPRQAPLILGLSGQEDWSGLPFPSSGMWQLVFYKS